MSGTSARLFVDDLPDLGAGARRFLIDCKHGTTRLIYVPVPGGLDLSERHLATVALQKHEDECGKCNLGRLWRVHGDPAIKEAVDRLWEQLRAMALRERRN